MYIPIWVLIGISIVSFFAYLHAKSTKETKSKVNDESWRTKLLEHAAKWKEITGRDAPTYEEMLELSEDYFETFLYLCAGVPEYQKILLQEMREHELKTGSFTKDQANEPWQIQAVSRMFSLVEGEEVTEAIASLDKVAKKYGMPDDGKDPVKMAIYAKAGHDYYERRRQTKS